MSKKKAIKLSEIQENHDFIKDIEVEKYTTITHKKAIVEAISDMCVEQEFNGMYYIDYFTKEIATVSFIIHAYCKNVEFNVINVDDMMYDFYVSSGMWNHVKNAIPKEEYVMFVNLLENTLFTKVKNKNSIEGILHDKLSKIIDIINNNLNPKEMTKLIKVFSKEFKNFDINKLGVLKDMYNIVQNPKKEKSDA